ncbi:hypothetical protein CDD82_1006 [Ophiocordyceps australis]|uniref:Arf-GAP domain-containing protein n=1 Tax=Ophiocordyceps australis TaxID=1399860 RepID=A0A2C5YLM8_9HYPO|nr:hypothetical protein CDD82_1006 [Ophiocordyceps australis]
MSRRAPNPAAERAAQNQATIKSLLKLEPNKICADCKRNKHPRWASWNLGVFICIRCSGIHRGMGTHISRVKSVDLDSWTDEQLQSILSWGNARANKYWEAKLAVGHTPSEAKIENFIRTKYELQRWVMDGPKPDPATLDAEGDDDVPLSLVKEKQAIERKESLRKAPNVSAPEQDLIGASDPVPPRASTAAPSASIPPKAEPAAPKTTSAKDSLLGLDFLGGSSAPPRPSSTPGLASVGQSRPDLKQSILSLYASAPKPQPQHTQQTQQRQGSFGAMTSPTFGHQKQDSFGGFNDALSGLNITSGPVAAPSDPFASLTGAPPANRTAPAPSGSSNAFGGLGGGGFFDAKPTSPRAMHQQTPSNSGFGGLNLFSSPPPAQPAVAPKPPQPSSSAMGDLFDLSSPITTQTSPPPVNAAAAAASTSSVFNLSAPQAKPKTSPPAASTGSSALGGFSGADIWGGNEWASADTSTQAAAVGATAPKSPPAKPATSSLGWDMGSGGGFASTPIVPGSGGGFNPTPKVAADEEFGGWASSTTSGAAAATTSTKPTAGFGGDEDLFSNVWQ